MFVACPFGPMMHLVPQEAEVSQRDAVIAALLAAIRTDTRIMLPKAESLTGSEVALMRAGEEPNPYGGTIGEFRYQFEGEDDLLHLMVVRQNYEPLTPEEGQVVAAFLLPELPPALIWLKPGTLTQNFYFGHDELLAIG